MLIIGFGNFSQVSVELNVFFLAVMVPGGDTKVYLKMFILGCGILTKIII